MEGDGDEKAPPSDDGEHTVEKDGAKASVPGGPNEPQDDEDGKLARAATRSSEKDLDRISK